MQTAQELRDRYKAIRERIDPRPANVVRLPSKVAPPPPIEAMVINLPPPPEKTKSDARVSPITFIIEQTAEHYGVSVADMKGQGRTITVMKPRHVAIYLARKLTKRSLHEIGARFGGRDHSTVLHAWRKIGAMIPEDAMLRRDIEAIEDEFAIRTVPPEPAEMTEPVDPIDAMFAQRDADSESLRDA